MYRLTRRLTHGRTPPNTQCLWTKDLRWLRHSCHVYEMTQVSSGLCQIYITHRGVWTITDSSNSCRNIIVIFINFIRNCSGVSYMPNLQLEIICNLTVKYFEIIDVNTVTIWATILWNSARYSVHNNVILCLQQICTRTNWVSWHTGCCCNCLHVWGARRMTWLVLSMHVPVHIMVTCLWCIPGSWIWWFTNIVYGSLYTLLYGSTQIHVLALHPFRPRKCVELCAVSYTHLTLPTILRV